MKKILLLLLMIALFANPCYARKTAPYKPLNDASGTALTDYALTNGVAVYSEPILVNGNIGFASILVTEDKAGGAGDVDISAEYSVDGVNFYPAYQSDMDGTITLEGVTSGGGLIVEALQNVTRWIAYTSRLSVWMRYKFDPDADSQITVKHIFQSES